MDVETLNGWKPPVIYDRSQDQSRIATQEDIDRLQSVAMDYGHVMGALRKLVNDAQMRRGDV